MSKIIDLYSQKELLGSIIGDFEGPVLTKHGHSSPDCQKGWDGCALLVGLPQGQIIKITDF